MRLYRVTRFHEADPLDARASITHGGWRWNDADTPTLYCASTASLALLEVTVRPGWHKLGELIVNEIELPDDTVVALESLHIALPSNWNWRPAPFEPKRVAAQAFKALRLAGTAAFGVYVPSAVNPSEANILIDPTRLPADLYATGKIKRWGFPFQSLVGTST